MSYVLVMFCFGVCGPGSEPKSVFVYETIELCEAARGVMKLYLPPVVHDAKGQVIEGMEQRLVCVPGYDAAL